MEFEAGSLENFRLLAPCSALLASLRAKLRRPCGRDHLLESGYVDPAEETDKVPFAFNASGTGGTFYNDVRFGEVLKSVRTTACGLA